MQINGTNYRYENPGVWFLMARLILVAFVRTFVSFVDNFRVQSSTERSYWGSLWFSWFALLDSWFLRIQNRFPENQSVPEYWFFREVERKSCGCFWSSALRPNDIGKTLLSIGELIHSSLWCHDCAWLVVHIDQRCGWALTQSISHNFLWLKWILFPDETDEFPCSSLGCRDYFYDLLNPARDQNQGLEMVAGLDGYWKWFYWHSENAHNLEAAVAEKSCERRRTSFIEPNLYNFWPHCILIFWYYFTYLQLWYWTWKHFKSDWPSRSQIDWNHSCGSCWWFGSAQASQFLWIDQFWTEALSW